MLSFNSSHSNSLQQLFQNTKNIEGKYWHKLVQYEASEQWVRVLLLSGGHCYWTFKNFRWNEGFSSFEKTGQSRC